MSRMLETQFNKGDFVLVLVKLAHPGIEPCEWRFVHLNEILRKYVGGTATK